MTPDGVCRGRKAALAKSCKVGPCNYRGVLFYKIFSIWTISKVLLEFVTLFLLFNLLDFWPPGVWDLSPPPRDRTTCFV